MLKLTKTGIGLLTRQYRSVLRKCWEINVGLWNWVMNTATGAVSAVGGAMNALWGSSKNSAREFSELIAALLKCNFLNDAMILKNIANIFAISAKMPAKLLSLRGTPIISLQKIIEVLDRLLQNGVSLKNISGGRCYNSKKKLISTTALATSLAFALNLANTTNAGADQAALDVLKNSLTWDGHQLILGENLLLQGDGEIAENAVWWIGGNLSFPTSFSTYASARFYKQEDNYGDFTRINGDVLEIWHNNKKEVELYADSLEGGLRLYSSGVAETNNGFTGKYGYEVDLYAEDASLRLTQHTNESFVSTYFTPTEFTFYDTSSYYVDGLTHSSSDITTSNTTKLVRASDLASKLSSYVTSSSLGGAASYSVTYGASYITNGYTNYLTRAADVKSYVDSAISGVSGGGVSGDYYAVQKYGRSDARDTTVRNLIELTQNVDDDIWEGAEGVIRLYRYNPDNTGDGPNAPYKEKVTLNDGDYGLRLTGTNFIQTAADGTPEISIHDSLITLYSNADSSMLLSGQNGIVYGEMSITRDFIKGNNFMLGNRGGGDSYSPGEYYPGTAGGQLSGLALWSSGNGAFLNKDGYLYLAKDSTTRTTLTNDGKIRLYTAPVMNDDGTIASHSIMRTEITGSGKITLYDSSSKDRTILNSSGLSLKNTNGDEKMVLKNNAFKLNGSSYDANGIAFGTTHNSASGTDRNLATVGWVLDNAGSGGGTWGTIGGTITDQTDLINHLSNNYYTKTDIDGAGYLTDTYIKVAQDSGAAAAVAYSHGDIAIGDSAVAGVNGWNYDATAIGYGAKATGSNSTALGNNTFATASGSVALGNDTHATGYGSIALGWNAHATGNDSTALGDNAYATGSGSTALGRYAYATGYGSTALGGDTYATAAGSIALGYGSEADESNAVSVGNSSTKRKIVNVAAGSADTDAVNYGQIKNFVTASTDALTNYYTKLDSEGVQNKVWVKDKFQNIIPSELQQIIQHIRQNAECADVISVANAASSKIERGYQEFTAHLAARWHESSKNRFRGRKFLQTATLSVCANDNSTTTNVTTIAA